MMLRYARALAALLALAASTCAIACPLCLYSVQLSLSGDDLFRARDAVLAIPEPQSRHYRVVNVVKGDRRVGELIQDSIFRADTGLAYGKPLLLLRQDRWASWVSFGAIDSQHGAWLRNVAAMPPPGDDDAAAWRTHVAYFLPYLDSPEPMLADVAYGEIRRAPYLAMRAQKDRLDVSALRRAVYNPAIGTRQALYVLLLGVAGDASDAARIEQRLTVARQTGDAANLGALLAADLELRGPSRMIWLEKTYLFDPRRTHPEVEAALSALSVHGSADATISRARVAATYRRFIQERKTLAGLVAPDLANWNDWSATLDYLALIRAGALQNPASRYAAVVYLMRSPRAADQAAARTFASQAN